MTPVLIVAYAILSVAAVTAVLLGVIIIMALIDLIKNCWKEMSKKGDD